MNENIVLTEVYNTYKINIINDVNPQNPRTEWDNFGTMVCFHKRYNLGDKHDLDIDIFPEFLKDKIYLPLYLYDHSGITISTGPFNCPWDSGQVGYIYVTKEAIRKEYSCKRITKDILNKVYALLESEVKTYDKYLKCEVYGYEVFDSSGDFKDSCYGYYDLPEEILKMVKEDIINHYDYQLSLELQEA